MNGIFSYLTASIDNALSTYVSSVSAQLAAVLAPIVISGLTIHYMLFGLAVMRGDADSSVPKFAWSMAKHTMIATLALTTATYQEWIVDSVSALTITLIQATSPSGATSVAMALDQMNAQGSDYALVVIGRGMTLMPIGGYLDVLAGFVIMLSNLALVALTGVWDMLAKVALTFMLAFGPLFISCLAFPATKKFFDAWLGKVLNYVLLIAFMAAITTFSTQIAAGFVSKATDNVGSTNALVDSFEFALLSIALIALTWQMPGIASGIAGGAAVSSPTGWATAMLTMSRRGNGSQDTSSASSAGGAISGGKGAQVDGSRSDSSQSGHTPAYRRATLDRLSKK